MNFTQQLPAWMSEKLGKIAAKTDLWQFEQEAIIILAAEISNYPEIAKILPDAFRAKVQEQKPRELEPIERAALAIARWNWLNVVDCFTEATPEAKIAAKLDALAFALREGGATC
jgi:hypothetical protein